MVIGLTLSQLHARRGSRCEVGVKQDWASPTNKNQMQHQVVIGFRASRGRQAWLHDVGFWFPFFPSYLARTSRITGYVRNCGRCTAEIKANISHCFFVLGPFSVLRLATRPESLSKAGLCAPFEKLKPLLD